MKKCDVEKVTEPCTDSPYEMHNSWYYCKKDQKCKQLKDGECGRSRNNFVSQELCEGRCMKDKSESSFRICMGDQTSIFKVQTIYLKTLSDAFVTSIFHFATCVIMYKGNYVIINGMIHRQNTNNLILKIVENH